MKFFQVCYFDAYVGIYQVRIMVFENDQTCPVPLSDFVKLLTFCYLFLFPFAVNSNSSTSSTRYDPDLLKVEVANAKARVAQIRSELTQMKAQVFLQNQEYRWVR